MKGHKSAHGRANMLPSCWQWQILARPDTFRDEVLPDEAAAFAAAGEACAQMWERHKQRREC